MNYNFLVILCALLVAINVYGQEQNNMDKLVTQCNKVVEYNQQIKSLKDRINNTYKQIENLRNSWEKVCYEYLTSDEQSHDDLQYLITNTNPETEIELYNKLIEAVNNLKYKKIESSLKHDEDAKPITTSNPITKDSSTPIKGNSRNINEDIKSKIRK